MNNRIIRNSYHWVVEEIDEHGDIADVRFSDTFPGIPVPTGRGMGYDVGLVVDTRYGRRWAYLFERGGRYILPTFFADSENKPTKLQVPLRFHAEVAAALAKRSPR